MIIKRAVIDKANRLYQLPPDIFSFTRERTKPSGLKKMELLDLARFNWPIPMEEDELPSGQQFKAADKQKISKLKETLADWLTAKHGVKLNPAKEIFVGGGISSLVLTTAIAFIDSGDIVFVPELGLPLYKKATTACGGEPVHYSVSPKNDWRPNFERITTRLGRVARLLFLNSPHNPTGTSLGTKDMEDLIWMASRENIVIVNDAAYQSIDPRLSTSLLSATGGKKVGVEICSFAYLFGLPPLPFGFVAGNRDIISGLESATNLIPTHIPQYYADLALNAIRQFPNEQLKRVREVMKRSSAEATKLLDLLSMEKSGYDSTPFVWARLSGRRNARTQASVLYRRSRILVAPGSAFGDTGEGYLRLSLTASHESYESARGRLKRKVNLIKTSDTS
ncbi:MAG: pyridoxal phosphate-dependent aminotransferase [Candidatus Zixiibacteriota bacterium]|nr:MAG: pyridoxal phosphate-dependent aminotransferase [candidate division Zixibacteria bacterium]